MPAFTSQKAVTGNTVTVDTLGNYFQVTPGTAVAVNTSTPVATGDVNTLALAFALVPSARAFTSVFTVKNISTQSRTAVLTPGGPSQVVSAVFASTGTTTATLAAGASTTVTVTTSNTIAGHGVVPEARPLDPGLDVPHLRALPRRGARGAAVADRDTAPGRPHRPRLGRVHDHHQSRRVRRLPQDRLRLVHEAELLPAHGPAYSDTTTTDGTTYTYKVNAVSTDAAPVTSLDSPAAVQTAYV